MPNTIKLDRDEEEYLKKVVDNAFPLVTEYERFINDKNIEVSSEGLNFRIVITGTVKDRRCDYCETPIKVFARVHNCLKCGNEIYEYSGIDYKRRNVE